MPNTPTGTAPAPPPAEDQLPVSGERIADLEALSHRESQAITVAAQDAFEDLERRHKQVQGELQRVKQAAKTGGGTIKWWWKFGKDELTVRVKYWLIGGSGMLTLIIIILLALGVQVGDVPAPAQTDLKTLIRQIDDRSHELKARGLWDWADDREREILIDNLADLEQARIALGIPRPPKPEKPPENTP